MGEKSDKSQTLSFKEKLKTINFGTVPGGYRDSNRHDKSAIEELDWPSKEEIMDYRSDYKDAPEGAISGENQPEYGF